MPITKPTLSKLVVSSIDSGKVKTTSSTASIVTSVPVPVKSSVPKSTGSLSKVIRKKITSAKVATELYDKSVSAYDFSESIYDFEITGSGATSAYPSVVASLPFNSFYKSGELTNFGYLYEIQNELRDASVIRANELVENYIKAFPVASASLSGIKKENIAKYNTLLVNIPQILNAKEQLLASTELPIYTDESIEAVNDLSSTTPADSSPRGASKIRTDLPASSTKTSSTKGMGGNLTVPFIDDDIQKYKDTTNIIEKLSESLLGINVPQQLNTTRQYQLLKAAISQLNEGLNFVNIEDNRFYGSPYTSLAPLQISPISQVTSEKIISDPDFIFAKKTLEDAALIMENGYLPPDKYSKSTKDNFLNDLSRTGLFYAGRISRDASGAFLVPSGSSTANFYDEPTFLFSSDVVDESMLPVLSLKSDFYQESFINQIAPVLASEITDAITSFSDLPSSIDPYEDSNVDTSATADDDIRFVSKLNNGNRIFLFDNSVVSQLEEGSKTIASTILLNVDQITQLKKDIDLVSSNLRNFVNKRKQQISNQCALTLLKIFYTKIQSYLIDVLPLAETDTFAALRTVFFINAASNHFTAARLYRLIYENDNEITNVIASGLSYKKTLDGNETRNMLGNIRSTTSSLSSSGLFDGSLITGIGSLSKPDFRNKVKCSSDIFGTAYKTFLRVDRVTETTKFPLDYLFTSTCEYQTIFQSAIKDVLEVYPSIKTNSKLIKKIKFSFYTMFLYFIKKLAIKNAEANVDFGYTATRNAKFDVQLESVYFLADCLSEAINNITPDTMKFSYFEKQFSYTFDPGSISINLGKRSLFNPARSPVKYSLQITQDIKSLIAYQLTVLKTQSNILTSLISILQTLTAFYGGDEKKALNLLKRYSTLESIVEMLYQTSRNLSFIPGTSISVNATRSENYRSIVKMAFKNYIPKKDNLFIYLVGIPYGHLDRLRRAQDDQIYRFGCTLFGDSSVLDEEEDNKIDYDFKYLESARVAFPKSSGPFNSLIANLYDNYSSTRLAENMQDDEIAYLEINDSFTSLDSLSRKDATPKNQAVDFPSIVVQAALQSYVEDLYGLYPRFSSYKGVLAASYPEERYADEVLRNSNIGVETEEDKVLYHRLRSCIMMHDLFVTSKMIDQIESSPVFDKIVYILADGNKFEDIITQIYGKLEV